MVPPAIDGRGYTLIAVLLRRWLGWNSSASHESDQEKDKEKNNQNQDYSTIPNISNSPG